MKYMRQIKAVHYSFLLTLSTLASKYLDVAIRKACANDKLNDRLENSAEKGGNAGYSQVLFSQCFQKCFFS